MGVHQNENLCEQEGRGPRQCERFNMRFLIEHLVHILLTIITML